MNYLLTVSNKSRTILDSDYERLLEMSFNGVEIRVSDKADESEVFLPWDASVNMDIKGNLVIDGSFEANNLGRVVITLPAKYVGRYYELNYEFDDENDDEDVREIFERYNWELELVED